MSNVDVSIGGREFKVACAAGEEDHIRDLGKMIDDKVSGLGMGGQSEGRMLLFASLLLADEVHETKYRGGSVDDAVGSAAASEDPLLAERLETIAATLEKCAARLEG